MNADDMSELFYTMKKACLDVGIEVLAFAGDGDPRMRKFQKNVYTKVPHSFVWLENLDYPIQFGLNFSGGSDFPCSDALHVLKKLRNNSKYLSTRLLLFTTLANLTLTNRLKWCARWECVVHLWHENENFRDAISKSAIAVKDKQDPSLATELLLLYPHFYEAGYTGMGLFLELGYLIFCAYYDKTLKPAERVLYASMSKAILIKWREEIARMRCLGKFFITSQSYDDFIACVDGLIRYVVTVVSKYPECDIVTWFLTSDSLEQFFAWLRTGMHAGRKTNLDACNILKDCGKRNLSLSMDGDNLHLLEHLVAHTRGKQLFKVRQDGAIYKGKDTSLIELKEAMKKGMKIGEDKFNKNSSFSKNTKAFSSDEEDEEDDSEGDESDREHLSEDEIEVESFDTMEDDEDEGLMKFGNDKKYHLQYAVAKYCNDGRTSMSSQTRVRRFTVVSSDKLSLIAECQGDTTDCHIISIGFTGSFVVMEKTKNKRKRKVVKEGTILFIAAANNDSSSPSRSSVNYQPLKRGCRMHKALTMYCKSQTAGELFKSTEMRI